MFGDLGKGVRIRPVSNAFRACEACSGMGFNAKGAEIADRLFPKCKACGGAGQIYLETKDSRDR